MKIKNILFVTFLFTAGIFVKAEKSVIIAQPEDTPLLITDFECSYSEAFSRYPASIDHEVSYRNRSGKTIVALQIGISAFDAFNGHMGRFSGWAIETITDGASNSGEWAQKPYGTFKFEKYGTGVCWVNAVRFEDGTVWRANMAKILIELQKYQKDLKAADLEDKKK